MFSFEIGTIPNINKDVECRIKVINILRVLLDIFLR